MLDTILCNRIESGQFASVQQEVSALKKFVQNTPGFGGLSNASSRKKFEQAATVMMLEARCDNAYKTSNSAGVKKEKVFAALKLPLLGLILISFMIKVLVATRVLKLQQGSTIQKVTSKIEDVESVLETFVLTLGGLFLMSRFSTLFQLHKRWIPNYMLTGPEVFMLDIMLSFVVLNNVAKILDVIISKIHSEKK
jgi:hypothetical protein